MNGWDYQARANEVETAQRAEIAMRLAATQPREIVRPKLDDPHATALQLELFEALPRRHFDFVERLLQQLPSRRQRDHFRKLYLNELKSVQDDGSIAFACGNKSLRTANDFIREIFEQRIGKVFAQYRLNLTYLSKSLADKWQWATQHSAENAELFLFGFDREHDNGIKGDVKNENGELDYLPFYLISDTKLEKLARDVAFIFQQKQNAYFNHIATLYEKGDEQETGISPNNVLDHIYEQCGLLCESIGFPYYYWESFQLKQAEEEEPNRKSMETALNKVICEKHWLKTFRKIQQQLLEHLRIACGEVCRNKSAYISADYLRFHDFKQMKGLDFLKNSILVNMDDEEEQVALFEMWFRSNANPKIRRYEMMTRLRGVEEWAEQNGYEALFLTLTAPSAFHAMHQNGHRNRKWQGASPKQTQAYLNKVWAQFRAILAKQKIDFKGMRVAEPHHDATPHWHLLFYVKSEHIDKVSNLFKQKSLELDGDERGAEEHRCKVEKCDKTKGSATAYIAKYISKNIGGFADTANASDKPNQTPELDLGLTLKSDEDENCTANENARRVKAWAGLWGIRQFQFYGIGSVTVWRELRRCVREDFKGDELMTDLFTAADEGEYAPYLELQAQGSTKNAPIKPYYEETEENQYGVINKTIKGIRNTLKQAVEGVVQFICTRKKKYKIVNGTKKTTASRNPVAESEASATDTGRSPAWTCVNNCNLYYPEGKAMDSLERVKNVLNANPELYKRLENALNLQQIPKNWVSDDKMLRLLEGRRIPFYGDTCLKFNGVWLEFC